MVVKVVLIVLDATHATLVVPVGVAVGAGLYKELAYL